VSRRPRPTDRAPSRAIADRIDPLAGIELAIFDKDGTLIDFHRMWRGWVDDLADRLEKHLDGADALDRLDRLDIRADLYALLGVETNTGRILPHGLLAATPMARIRDRVGAMLERSGASAAAIASALGAAWHAPDPVALASPLTDLPALFRSLADRGCAIAVATSDDRAPTERTLKALGVAPFVRALACADDGGGVKPAPDAVHRLCAAVGVGPERTAVIGDSPADLGMGRAAGVGRTIGVLSGVGDRDSLGPAADLLLDSIADLLPGGRAATEGGLVGPTR
jgi:phosphoglycolate phosphatase-like HAD superfamily hydrolase